MTRLASILALPCALAFAACTSHGGSPTEVGLQMSDLSVMFPLPQTQADLDAMLAPTAMANGGALFPQSVHDSVGVDVAYQNLRAVAFRLDPCFGQLGTISNPGLCDPQLRVVFQPVDLLQVPTGSANVEDAAIHVFYSLTQAQYLDAVREVQSAREAAKGNADLGALAPSSIMTEQGLTGTYAAQLEQIITTYAGAANIIRFTAFTIELFDAPAGANVFGGGEFWEFQSFTVASGSATPHPIVTLPDQETAMGLNVAANPLATSFSPPTTSADNLDILASMSTASTATPAALGSAFDSALRILNPHDNSPDTIDCASCHMAQPAIQLVGAPLGLTPAGHADAFVPSANIPSADLQQTTTLVGSDQVLNIHAFSYRNAEPMINQRVINETAANVAYTATLL